MADKSIGEGGRGRKAEPELTTEMGKWRDSIAARDRIYAVSYRQAIDGGKSPEDARVLAREAFLRSFESSPEILLVVNLEQKPTDE